MVDHLKRKEGVSMVRAKSVRRLLAVMVAAMMLLGGVMVAPASAAENYTLGSIEAPAYVMNDHTPFGVRFSVDASSGLAPNETYYVKLRLSPNTTPSSSANRGFTWNPATGKWIMERESINGSRWVGRPTVTTDETGAIKSTWVYGKFGNEGESGDYYILVSLSDTGDESSYNPDPGDVPMVTVLDAKTEGSWVHNGLAGLAAADKRVGIRSSDSTSDGSPATLYGLWQTEENGVDDDGDGMIDDASEDVGPAGMTGDYRVALPIATVVDIYTNRILRADDFTTGAADCDMAVGASDQTAPLAATDAAAEAAAGAVDLSWNAGSDSGGSGIEGYLVYRWPAVNQYDLAGMTTNPPVLIGKAAGTVFSDTTARGGVAYEYAVRTIDGDSNISARSNIATATAIAANDLVRDDGATRYETAIETSKSTFAAGSVDTVVVATGNAFADALAGSSLAGAYDSPLLLVGSTMGTSLKNEIDRLGAGNVVLLGGTAAISDDVAQEFANAGYTVDRIQGQDRYETAAKIAQEVADLTGGVHSAYFVRGDDFADAIAISPFAYGTATPILLVRTGSVPAYTSAAIASLGITEGGIAGGYGAVSSDAEDALETLLGNALERWAGANRYATARLVADAHVAAGTASYNYVGVATGLDFPDALGGGAAAGSWNGVLLLTRPDSLVLEVSSALSANKDMIDEVHVFGGTSAVSAAVYNQIAQILQ